MVTKESWIKVREGGSYDLEHIHFGLNLNPTINLELSDLKGHLNLFKQMPRQIIYKVLEEVKLRLDKEFGIQTLLNEEGKEIMLIK